MYLVPDVIEKEEKKIVKRDWESGEKYFINFEGDNFQPFFLDSVGNPLDLKYSVESILFKSDNDNLLNAWILNPTEDFNGTTMLWCHGNAGNLTSQYRLVTPLVERGYRVFLFDYSGFGFSEGEATRKNVLIDGNSALDYLLYSETLKSEKLIIYGQSLGGHLAGSMSADRQNDIDGVVMEGAFSSHHDIGATVGWIFARMFITEKYKAKKEIKSYNKPVLIIHSTEDKRIPFEMGEKLYENANEPKSFYQIEKCHICGPLFYADSISFKIDQMLNK
jgi:alpha-beta hydrolase superfamily lysophospholipase